MLGLGLVALTALVAVKISSAPTTALAHESAERAAEAVRHDADAVELRNIEHDNSARGAAPQEARPEVELTPDSDAPPLAQKVGFEPIDWSNWQTRPRVPHSDAMEISGLVLLGANPIPHATVRAWPRRSQGPIGERRPKATHSAITDPDGRFTLKGVAHGEWTVEAESNEQRAQCFVELPVDQRSSPGVLIVFGNSSLEVTVYDDFGTPLAGVHTYLAGIGPAPARFAGAKTDEAGKVRFEGLASGRYHVISGRTGSFESPGQALVEIDVGEHQHVSLGNESAPVRFSGRIVNAEGAPRPLGENLRAVHTARGDKQWIRVQSASFEANLTPGRWTIHRAIGPRLGEQVGDVTIEASPVNRDIVVPVVRSIDQVDAPGAK